MNLDPKSSRAPIPAPVPNYVYLLDPTAAPSISARRDGYNAWRDAFRPSQILAGLCQRCGLPQPEYRVEAVKVGSKLFRTSPETLPPGTSLSLLDNPEGARW